MSLASKNNWRPSATQKTLLARADLYKKIRAFFHSNHVLEVETPLLSQFGVTDRHIDNIVVPYQHEIRFLQTSPEYAMKRLLAAGVGSIYQICKAFRMEECGRHHNPEFTMLEWYRLDFNQHDLMDEMDQLLQILLECPPALRLSYQAVFQRYLALDPLKTNVNELLTILQQHAIALSTQLHENADCDSLLQLIQSHIIEPQLPTNQPVFIYDFPKSQAALAKIDPTNQSVAQRFEVYFQGIELANGFCELTDAAEQQQRFINDQRYRAEHQLAAREIDTRFIAALEQGLPNCSGVALGLDRVLMLKLGLSEIQEVLSFGWARA